MVCIIALVVALGLSFFRIFKGAELTDEAFLISESFICVNGSDSIPIINAWSQSPLFVLLLAPFIKFFWQLRNNNTEGIILFGRVVYWIYKVIISAFFYSVIKDSVSMFARMIAAALLIMCNYCSILSFGYISGSIEMTIISALLLSIALDIAFFGDNTRYKLYSFLSGICLCASAVCSPVQAITCIGVAFIIVLTELIYKKRLQCFWYFTLGGGGMAIGILVFLLYKGGMEGIIHGLDMVLNKNPYIVLKNTETVGVLDTLIYILNYHRIYVFSVALLFAVYVLVKLKKGIKLNVNNLYAMAKLLYFITYVFFLVYALANHASEKEIQQRLTIPLIGALPLCFFGRKRDRMIIVCIAIEVYELLWMLSADLFSYGGIYGKCYGLIGITMCYMAVMTHDLLGDVKHEGIRDPLQCAPVVLSILVIIVVCYKSYSYIYRDAPVSELKHIIERGIYKGIHTTKERASGLQELEDNVKLNTTEDDYILFMEVVPFAYIMSNGKACTPSTWDISLYSYGFNTDEQYMEYFSTINKIPSKIIYIETGRDDHLSIDEPGYKFNAFVNENYSLTKRVDDAYYPMRVYTLKALDTIKKE